MFEQLMTLVFLAPVAPSDTWAGGRQPVNQAASPSIRLEVSGPPHPGCLPRTLPLPVATTGAFRFEDRGVRYSGTETNSGQLVIRSDGARPLTLSGDRAGGGLWSIGTDGRCVGVWKPDGPLDATRR
jgi:hypothetical protein